MGHQVQDRGKNRWHFPPSSLSSCYWNSPLICPAFLVPYMSSGIYASLCSGESERQNSLGGQGCYLQVNGWCYLQVNTSTMLLLLLTPLGKVVMCTQDSGFELPEVPPALARGESLDGFWLLLGVFERRDIGATVEKAADRLSFFGLNSHFCWCF